MFLLIQVKSHHFDNETVFTYLKSMTSLKQNH